MNTLLFIDDHLPILQMLKRRFEKLDYHVYTALGIDEAIPIIEKNGIDLIVIDYMMPNMSGFDFLLFKKNRNIPTIMMTAHSSINLAITFLKNGGTDYIEKPIDVDILNIKIIQAISNKEKLDKAIKARLAAEQQLRTSNEALVLKTKKLELANEQLDAFASSIAHDLRAPLRQISSFSTLIKRRNSKNFDEESIEFLDFIQKASSKMNELIQSLYDFSRSSKEELKLELIELNPFVKKIVDDLIKIIDTPAQFEWQDLPKVYADKTLLEQVFINLIGNAIKYSSKKEQPIIKINAQEETDKYIFSIVDNGVGFDMANSDKLFKIFKRLHSEHDFEGSGVGLSIVKSIVEKHDGEVWASSKPGLGATFSFSLPKE